VFDVATRIKIIRHWKKYNQAIVYDYKPIGGGGRVNIAVCLPPEFTEEIRLPLREATYTCQRFFWNLLDPPEYYLLRPRRYYHKQFRWKTSFPYKDFERQIFPYIQKANQWIASKINS
jgi:hypothetical protein